MKCQILFLEKEIRINIINLSSAEFAYRVINAKLFQVGRGKVRKRKNDLFFNVSTCTLSSTNSL